MNKTKDLISHKSAIYFLENYYDLKGSIIVAKVL